MSYIVCVYKVPSYTLSCSKNNKNFHIFKFFFNVVKTNQKMAYFSVFEINVSGVIVQNKLILFIVISHDKVIRLSSLATDEDIFFSIQWTKNLYLLLIKKKTNAMLKEQCDLHNRINVNNKYFTDKPGKINARQD